MASNSWQESIDSYTIIQVRLQHFLKYRIFGICRNVNHVRDWGHVFLIGVNVVVYFGEHLSEVERIFVDFTSHTSIWNFAPVEYEG